MLPIIAPSYACYFFPLFITILLFLLFFSNSLLFMNDLSSSISLPSPSVLLSIHPFFISNTSPPAVPLPWLPILFYPCLSEWTMPFSIKPILNIYCTMFLVLGLLFTAFLITHLLGSCQLPGGHWEVSMKSRCLWYCKSRVIILCLYCCLMLFYWICLTLNIIDRIPKKHLSFIIFSVNSNIRV